MKKSREQRKKLKAKVAKRFEQELKNSQDREGAFFEAIEFLKSQISKESFEDFVSHAILCPSDCKGDHNDEASEIK